ncbi:uncharacterized protein LOC129769659 [Toxorhynchites rutilus septentrionalis]|uniref:uncharacterized protein LOC129769659 n=1 Tax=Toxorhynchites rutilus septentrionalis TaxID=329112 RepID=UPI0024784AA7|nr:uncharacterized protein LOC129769659 [Toxorhynchites rutilus septentrionalis]
MNCSCSADPCPHVQYIRSLLETTEKDRLRAEESKRTGWMRASEYFGKAVTQIGSFLKIAFFLWVAMTKAALKLWLYVLNSDSYLWLCYLIFALAIICSLPGVRSMSMSTMRPEEGGSSVGNSLAFDTGLIVGE